MAFAITEPGAGSGRGGDRRGACAHLVTTAKKRDKGFVISRRKCFISDGAIADKVTLYAKLDNESIESWTCFLVEKGMKGFSVDASTAGQRAADASELITEDVFVPDTNVVGPLRSGWANNAMS